MYNVGDKVVIMDDLRVGQYGTSVVTQTMVSYAGETLVVKDVLQHNDNRREYLLIGDYYNWTNEMIDHEKTIGLKKKLYKTWEMIRELNKNPHKKFKRKSDGLEMEVNSKGELRWKSGHDYMKPNQTWLEHRPQPVEFTEAVKAHQSNCDIICVESGIKNIYRTNIIGRLVNESGTPVTTAEILSGTWYIKG